MSAVAELTSLASIFRAQHLPREVLEARQAARVREMVRHCRSTVPFYARPEYAIDIESLRDVARLPVLAKPTIIDAGERELRSTAHADRDVIMTETSGTTGRKLAIAHDRGHMAHHNAACMRRFFATGVYRPWFRLVHLRPMEAATRWYQHLRLFRRTVAVSSWPPEHIKQVLLDERPHAIIGYPTMLRELIRSLEPAELAAVRRHLRLIFTESELLIDAHREQLTDVFGVPVFDEYSAYEVLNISFECSEGHAHVAEDRVLVELVDDEGALVPEGTEGTVVVTAFWERAMPLIRYRLGDRARFVPGSCACGRTFRRLDLTQGRSDDHVVLPDGSVLYAASFLYLAARLPGVAESMVRQDADGRITAFVMPEPGTSFETVTAAYRERLNQLAEREVALEFEPMDRVPFTAGGKGKFIESGLRR